MMKRLSDSDIWPSSVARIVVLVFMFLCFCGVWRCVDVHGAAFDLHQAIQGGDKEAWRRLVAEGQSLEMPDEDGNTPLHLAALWGETKCVNALLSKGVDANVLNVAGATPLLYGITDESIVRDLLRFGADPNSKSKLGMTPFLAAVTRGRSYKISQLLVAAGADIHVNREGPWDGGALYRAIQSGDPRTIDLLFQKGVRIEAFGKSYSPLHMASMVGDLPSVKRLVEAGADINYWDPGWGDAPGHAFNWAMWAENHEVAGYLMDQGADLTFAPSIGTETPPMVWAGFGQTTDPKIAKRLLARGLDINTKNARGETALSYALQNGEKTELVRFLRAAGAQDGGQRKRRKVIPSRGLPGNEDARKTLIRNAAQRAIDLMQSSSERFLNRRESCVSCHHQLLPALAFGMARERGLEVDEMRLGQQLAAQVQGTRENVKYGSLELVYGGFNGGKGLFALHALGYEGDETVWYDARFLRETQSYNGTWSSFGRAPMDEPSAIQQTAWAIGGLRLYPRIANQEATLRRLERAMNGLRTLKAETVTQRSAQLLGLHWGGDSATELASHVQNLLEQQGADGGWAQLPSLKSDAWATGQSLYALNQAGAISTHQEAYRRGVDFLLRTQFEDGSWWVKTRAWPFQPHFDSGFPHGRDQWISIAGTAWAAMALLATLPPDRSVPIPTGQELIARWEAHSKTLQTATLVDEVQNASRSVSFERRIRPLFERSCLNCHSGERPKGSFRITTRAELMEGGQSGEASVNPGDGDGSMLVKYVGDQVEDMEMPPIHKRNKYPSLTSFEIASLIRWINEGAVWPPETKLGAD